MRYPILIGLIFFLGNTLFGQKPLFPIRKNDKWGYITSRGRIAKAPEFDLLNENSERWRVKDTTNMPKCDYRLAQISGKLGILDERLSLVLPCDYSKIYPLSPSYFAVAKENKFGIIKLPQTKISPFEFDDIVAYHARANNSKFLVQKDGNWGIWDLKKGLICPTQYFEIQTTLVDSFFVVKTDKEAQYGLISSSGAWILPPAYHKITVIGEKYSICTIEEHSTIIENGSNTILFPKKYYGFILHLAENLTLLNDGTELNNRIIFNQLDGTLSKKISGQHYLGALDGQAIRFSPIGRSNQPKSKGILSLNMDTLLAPSAIFIENSGVAGIYRIMQANNVWRYFKASNQQLSPKSYERIFKFDKNLALVQNVGLYGVVDTSFREVIAPIFSEIIFLSSTELQAIDKNGGEFIFKKQSSGTFEMVQAIEKGKSIKIGFIDWDQVHEAKERFQRAQQSLASDSETIPYEQRIHALRSDTAFQWELHPLRKTYGLKDKLTNSFVFDQFFTKTHTFSLEKDLVFNNQNQVYGNLATLCALPNQGLSPATFFDRPSLQLESKTKILGFRYFADHETFTPFMALNGKMGLMDKDGNIKKDATGKPFLCSFIGPYVFGKARFCVGGKMSSTKEYTKYALGKAADIVESLHLHSLYPNGKQAYEGSRFDEVFIENDLNSAPLWGVLDENGEILLEPSYEFISDFSTTDSTLSYYKDGKKGFFDFNLKNLIPAEFEAVAPYFGYFKVSLPNPYLFFVRPDGTQIADVGYDRYHGFSDNRCDVRRAERWGFINYAGEEIIECRYDTVCSFSDGLAKVNDQGKWTYIDTSGRTVIDLARLFPNGVECGYFKEGLCIFKENKLYGIMDKKGEIIVAPSFHFITEFHKGVAAFRFKKHFGILNSSGKTILEPKEIEQMTAFDENGLAHIKNDRKSGKWALTNTDGKILTEYKYTEIQPFKDGMAIVRSASGFGLINTLGQEVIPTKYVAIDHYNEGAVAVKIDKHRWVYMDSLGKRLTPEDKDYLRAESFQQGYAIVDDGKVIDKTGFFQSLPYPVLDYSEGIFVFQSAAGDFYGNILGENLFDRHYKEAAAFDRGFAKYFNGRFWGAINPNGLTVVTPKFNFIHVQNDGNVVVRPPRLFGLLDKRGNVLLEPIYDRVSMMESGLMRVEFGTQLGYYHPEMKKWIWEMQN